MAILHLVQYSLPEITSGYTLRTRAILAAQQELGLDPVVLTSPRQPECEEVEVEGVPHFRCRPERPTKLVWLRDARRVQHLAARVVRLAQARGDVQVLHAHSPVLCGLAALRAGRELGLPVVYEVRGLWEEAMRGRSVRYRAARAMETRVCRRADAVVALCERLREEFIGRGVEAAKISVVPNGVDLHRFDPAAAPPNSRARYGLGAGPVLLYLGALREYEGIGVLLEAFPQIRARRPEAQLLIVGAGEAREQVAARVQALGEGVHLLPPVPHAETPALYAAADVVVYPRLSTRATECVTPLKPLEAMAMGKAILASQVGGLSELLEEGVTARLFPAGDPKALAEGCLALLAEAGLRERLGEAARAQAERRFDWRVIARTYLEVYARVGGGPLAGG